MERDEFGDLVIKCASYAYGDIAHISSCDGICDVCKKNTRVLCVDTSDGEYAILGICAECIDAEMKHN